MTVFGNVTGKNSLGSIILEEVLFAYLMHQICQDLRSTENVTKVQRAERRRM